MKFEEIKNIVDAGNFVELIEGALYAIAADAAELKGDKEWFKSTNGFVWHTNDGAIGTIDGTEEWEEFKKEYEIDQFLINGK